MRHVLGAILSVSLAATAAAASDAVPLPSAVKSALPFLANLDIRAQDTWIPEAAFAVFIILFLVNIFKGRKSNERRAISWATKLISAESRLPDNFSLVGPGGTAEGEVVVRENMNMYCVHASGRRYCKSLQATLFLRKRQDLIAWAVSAVTGTPDVLDIEVKMQPGAMPPLVLLIAKKELARSLVKDNADIKTYTKLLEVKKESWPSKELAVHAEQASNFNELMTSVLLEHSFGPGAWAELGSIFRSLHITSEGQGGDTGDDAKFINLSLVLPKESEYRKVLEWIRALIILIDSLGTYKFTPDQAKRASENRSRKEALALQAAEEKRQEAIAARREKKAADEQERLRRMTPQQREKELERKQRIRQRRGMSRFVKKM